MESAAFTAEPTSHDGPVHSATEANETDQASSGASPSRLWFIELIPAKLDQMLSDDLSVLPATPFVTYPAAVRARADVGSSFWMTVLMLFATSPGVHNIGCRGIIVRRRLLRETPGHVTPGKRPLGSRPCCLRCSRCARYERRLAAGSGALLNRSLASVIPASRTRMRPAPGKPWARDVF
jgi:hypothetical protein